MRKSEASSKTPEEAAYSGDEHDFFNSIREHPHPHIPEPSHEGVSAPPWRQEGTLLPGYSWHQLPPGGPGSLNAPLYPPAEATYNPYPSFQYPPAITAAGSLLAPHYPPAEATNTPYPPYQYPPVMTAADSLQAGLSLTHYTQATSTLHTYHQSRESMVYEQLMRTADADPLHGMAHLHGMAPLNTMAAPESLRDPYSVPVVPRLPPWLAAPSVGASHFPPSLAPESSNFPYNPRATAPERQYFPPQHGSLSSPQHQGSEAVEARALIEASMRPPDTKVNPREKRRQLTRASDPFPVRLFRLLSDLESSEENLDIASFTASGNAFQIIKPLEFMQDVAPRYFRQKHYSSFTRQLNCYGFHKVSHGPDKGAFCHPNFQRDEPELCKRITAKVTEDYRSARVAETNKHHSTHS